MRFSQSWAKHPFIHDAGKLIVFNVQRVKKQKKKNNFICRKICSFDRLYKSSALAGILLSDIRSTEGNNGEPHKQNLIKTGTSLHSHILPTH